MHPIATAPLPTLSAVYINAILPARPPAPTQVSTTDASLRRPMQAGRVGGHPRQVTRWQLAGKKVSRSTPVAQLLLLQQLCDVHVRNLPAKGSYEQAAGKPCESRVAEHAAKLYAPLCPGGRVLPVEKQLAEARNKPARCRGRILLSGRQTSDVCPGS